MSERPSTLKEQIATEPTRPRVVAECATLIDQQVKTQSGFKGVAIKTAYGAIKTLKRNFVPHTVDALLDDWLDKLEPYYQTWSSGGSGGFAEYLTARSDDVAEDLLEVTDTRAETTKHTTAKKYYFKHRDKAKDNVVQAVPELAKLLDRHLAGTEQGAGTDSAASA